MNEQLQAALADILKSLQAGADQVGGVAREQLPLLVQEYLAWGFWRASFWCVFGVALVAAALLISGHVRRTLKSFDNCSGDMEEMAWVLLGRGLQIFGPVPGVIVFLLNAQAALQIAVAPRVYLLEQVAKLVK